MTKALTLLAASMLAATAAPALAQNVDVGDYNGVYVGGSFGFTAQANDRGSRVLFDTDRDGRFGDTVFTGFGFDAFAPGFCPGRATSATGGCRGDRDGKEYYGMAGADSQIGRIVVGVVGEFGKSEARDAVTAFSSSPASYTLERRQRYSAAVRGRLGYTPNDTTLFYGTGGASWAKFRNRFSTTNTANAFSDNGGSEEFGYNVGGGVEQRFGRNFSVGLLYLYTKYRDRDFRVTATRGNALQTNPFTLRNAAGTDFARSDAAFETHSMRITGAFRF